MAAARTSFLMHLNLSFNVSTREIRDIYYFYFKVMPIVINTRLVEAYSHRLDYVDIE